jgi:hypothetical protein
MAQSVAKFWYSEALAGIRIRFPQSFLSKTWYDGVRRLARRGSHHCAVCAVPGALITTDVIAFGLSVSSRVRRRRVSRGQDASLRSLSLAV